jgi:hypothetical protein
MKKAMLFVFIIALVLTAPAVFGKDINKAEAGQQALTGRDDWPAVAKNQVRHTTPRASVLACDVECGPEDIDPVADLLGGSGTTEWSLCKPNKVCNLTPTGQCVSASYATCQVRLSGSGQACQAC